tara:strand:+ start:280 stop:444 length:165 start_codon:yes stop_codon:yes gene_type:complete
MLEAQIVKLTKEALDIAEDEKNGIQPKPKPQAKVKAKAKVSTFTRDEVKCAKLN